MKIFSIIIGKLIVLMCKILGRGSAFPGGIALKIDKNLLRKFSLPDNIIAVTGSSGKGSTTSIIRKIFEDQGYTVCHNESGANMGNGVVTTFLEQCSLTGKIKKDLVILEVDERYTPFLFKDVKPNVLVVTNICRDQPPRQGSADRVFEKIDLSITHDMTIITNGDDPYLRNIELNNPDNKIIYYGINKNKYSYKDNIFTSLNISYCPKCHKKIEYKYRIFEEYGDYYCSSCDFKKPKCACSVTNIDYENNNFTINKKYVINLQYNVLFSIYNTLAAFTVCDLYKLDMNLACESLNTIYKNKKIFSEYHIGDRKVVVLNNKNENRTTFNQTVFYISRFKEKKVLVIGWMEISRRYIFNDMSWLYDIEFELLNDDSIEKVVCIGRDAYNIAARIKSAGFKEDDIVCFDNVPDGVEFVKNKTEGNVYGILNFDYIEPFNTLMRRDNNED